MRIVYVSKPKKVMHHFVDGGILKKIYSTPFYWYKNKSTTPHFFLFIFKRILETNDSCLMDDEYRHNDKLHNAGIVLSKIQYKDHFY